MVIQVNALSKTENNNSEIKPIYTDELVQNYPNPFNPNTRIVFDLPERVSVKLKIYDLLGREVKILVEQDLVSGRYEFDWNGRDESGQLLSSGVYVYRLEALGSERSFIQMRKMVLLK